jgi:hypothetical protein
MWNYLELYLRHSVLIYYFLVLIIYAYNTQKDIVHYVINLQNLYLFLISRWQNMESPYIRA